MVSRDDWWEALLRDPRIGAATFGVACALTRSGGDFATGKNFGRSVQKIGKELFAKSNSAQPHVKRLREFGYLTPAGSELTKDGTVNYTLTLPTDVPEQTPARTEPVKALTAPTEAVAIPAARELPEPRRSKAEPVAANPIAAPELPSGVSVAYSDADKAAVALSHGLVWDEAAGDWQPLPDKLPEGMHVPELPFSDAPKPCGWCNYCRKEATHYTVDCPSRPYDEPPF